MTSQGSTTSKIRRGLNTSIVLFSMKIAFWVGVWHSGDYSNTIDIILGGCM